MLNLNMNQRADLYASVVNLLLSHRDAQHLPKSSLSAAATTAVDVLNVYDPKVKWGNPVGELADMRRTLDEADARIKRLREDNAGTQRELARSDKDLQAAVLKISGLRLQLNDMQKELDAVSADRDEWREKAQKQTPPADLQKWFTELSAYLSYFAGQRQELLISVIRSFVAGNGYPRGSLLPMPGKVDLSTIEAAVHDALVQHCGKQLHNDI